MANPQSGVRGTQLSLSIDSVILAAIQAHAEAAGMDVSAYLMAAAIAQMAADDAVSAEFAPLDTLNAMAYALGADKGDPAEPA